jgi:hypothetical protein
LDFVSFTGQSAQWRKTSSADSSRIMLSALKIIREVSSTAPQSDFLGRSSIEYSPAVERIFKEIFFKLGSLNNKATQPQSFICEECH